MIDANDHRAWCEYFDSNNVWHTNTFLLFKHHPIQKLVQRFGGYALDYAGEPLISPIQFRFMVNTEERGWVRTAPVAEGGTVLAAFDAALAACNEAPMPEALRRICRDLGWVRETTLAMFEGASA